MRSLAGLVRVLAAFAMVAPVVEAAGARVRGRAATTFEVGKATTAATTEASGTGTTHQQLDPEFQRARPNSMPRRRKCAVLCLCSATRSR